MSRGDINPVDATMREDWAFRLLCVLVEVGGKRSVNEFASEAVVLADALLAELEKTNV